MVGGGVAAGAVAGRGPLAASAPASLPGAQRPNVLWITCEDTSPDLGCYGDKYAVTPNLDKLAAEGARFTNAFTHAPVCAPSRSGIITGMYPTTIGTLHMRSQGVPPPNVKCFTEYLRAAGHYCTNDVKTDYNFACPLTAWDECRKGADWRGRAKGQPFFSVINIVCSHESQSWDINGKLEHDPDKAVLPPYYPDTPVVRKNWARCYDQVTKMDGFVGGILKRLADDGLADSTIVFFYGDHGRGLTRAKRWVYDSGTHVPLIVRWPGVIKPGSVREDFACFIDLAPTMLSLAGVPIPKYMQGRAFLGTQAGQEPQYVFAARDRMDETYDIIRAVRDKKYKYIRNFQPEKPYTQEIKYMDKMPILQEMRKLNAEGKLQGAPALFFRATKPKEELYDITADPHEVNDLADKPEHQEALKRMREALEKWMKDTGDLGLMPEDELKEKMRPGGKVAETASPTVSPNGGKSESPIEVKLSCATEGASIAYTLAEGKDAAWKLYSAPVTLSASATLRAKACRLGYKDGAEVQASFQVGK
jgi:uncharacterized sulfatase